MRHRFVPAIGLLCIWLAGPAAQAMLATPGRGAERKVNQRVCRGDVLAAVIRDDDDSAPFVLATRRGRGFRVLGQDFIDPARWRHGERLRLCRDSGMPRGYDLVNSKRRERLSALSVTTPLSQAAAAAQVTALALRRLGRTAPHVDVQFDHKQGSELLFAAHDRSGCAGGQPTCSTLVGHFAIDARTGAIHDTDKQDAEGSTP